MFFWYFFIAGITLALLPIIHLFLTKDDFLMEYWFHFYAIGIVLIGIWLGCMIGIKHEQHNIEDVSNTN